MIEYQNLVLNNFQFKDLCNQQLNCNSFLFESADEVFLNNFSYLIEKGEPKIPCLKYSLDIHEDL